MEQRESNRKQGWREYRRRRVWEMYGQGYTQRAIAQALGLSQGGVSQILQRVRAEGEAALRGRKAPGGQAKLTLAQKGRLLEMLAQGAEAFGFHGDVWTCERVAHLIETEFGVHYHADYIGPLLRSCGWSVQKPTVRATQRDEAAIQQWLTERWPEVKKKP
jgi:transposase